jgi:hypothetical protein
MYGKSTTYETGSLWHVLSNSGIRWLGAPTQASTAKRGMRGTDKPKFFVQCHNRNFPNYGAYTYV